MRYIVEIEPYRLDEGHVGESIYRSVKMSEHRSPRAARRALIRLITGTDTRAKDYLKGNDSYPIALRYQVRDCGTAENPKYVNNKFSANNLPLGV